MTEQRGPATVLLAELFRFMPATWADKSCLNLVVIGAGRFPSFLSLVLVLREQLPFLTDLQMTLVEPVQFRTSIFQQQFAKFQKKNLIQLNTHIKIYNGLLNEFLEGPTQQKFDVLYFEHADFRTLPLLFSQLIGIGWRTVRLRHALPYLTEIMGLDALIIASCLSQRELFLLKSLLQFSFNVRPQLVKLAGIHHYWYGGPYQSGLAVESVPAAHRRLQKMRAKCILAHDQYFGGLFFISCLVLGAKMNSICSLQEIVMAILVLLLQFFFQGPRLNNRPFQLLLLLGLLMI